MLINTAQILHNSKNRQKMSKPWYFPFCYAYLITNDDFYFRWGKMGACKKNTLFTYHSALQCSHSIWSKLTKIPMHIKFAGWIGKYHEKFSFWQYMQFAAFWEVFHSIVKSYCMEDMVWINSPSKLPMCIKFWWKRWIYLVKEFFSHLPIFIHFIAFF